jgi:hypothetical protein
VHPLAARPQLGERLRAAQEQDGEQRGLPGDSPSACSSSCRCLSLRSPVRCTVRSSPCSRRPRTAMRTVATSYVTTGSRLVVWLQAASRALSVSG